MAWSLDKDIQEVWYRAEEVTQDPSGRSVVSRHKVATCCPGHIGGLGEPDAPGIPWSSLLPSCRPPFTAITALQKSPKDGRSRDGSPVSCPAQSFVLRILRPDLSALPLLLFLAKLLLIWVQAFPSLCLMLFSLMITFCASLNYMQCSTEQPQC